MTVDGGRGTGDGAEKEGPRQSPRAFFFPATRNP